MKKIKLIYSEMLISLRSSNNSLLDEQIYKHMVKDVLAPCKALEQITTAPNQAFIIRGSFKANLKTCLFKQAFDL